MSKLVFIRHAQASFMADNYDQLSEKGIKQSALLGPHLAQAFPKFDKVFTGPLERQKHTAKIVEQAYQKLGLNFPEPIRVQGMREHMATHAMHKARPQLEEKAPQAKIWLDEADHNPEVRRRNNLRAFQLFMDIYAKGEIRIEGIETWQDFRSEVKTGLHKILEETEQGETNAIFTSGGTIASITAESLAIQDETKVTALNFSIRNTSINTFLYSKGQFNLQSLNDVSHLEKDMITFV